MSLERRGRAGYAALLGFMVVVAALSLALSRSYSGHFATPPLFLAARVLFFVQQGLFIGLVLSVVVLLVQAVPSAAARCAVVVLPVYWAIWLTIWGLVHAVFGIRLSLGYIWELLSNPASLHAAGLKPVRLLLSLGVLALMGAAIAFLLQRSARTAGTGFQRTVVVVLLLGFLPIHFAVRGYVVHYAIAGDRAVLALDEATPLGLRTEFLLPGIRHRRLFIPNLENRTRTAEYLRWADTVRYAALNVPHRLSQLWILIESFRFDAITEKGMPYLSAHRGEFQIRRERDHWSGGNETKAGTFALLSGVAGYHMPSFRRAGIRFPFLSLLAANGYRVRIAKGWHFDWGALRDYFPGAATLVRIGTGSLSGSDRQMVDSFLRDVESRDPATPSFDLLTFDAPHWPYQYPDSDAVFSPAPRLSGPTAYALSPAETLGVHNRYRNSLHFVDAEIGRVLETLRSRKLLDSTMVIITGDHGEEFLERGQLAHASAMDDYQGRVPLWIRVPGTLATVPDDDSLTSNLDVIPTVLDLMGFQADVLRTQGVSLLGDSARPPMLLLAEQGPYYPTYHALVSRTYLSRWRDGREEFLFTGVDRRDGLPVRGDQWWTEVQAGRATASAAYEILPDPAGPPIPFRRP